MITQAVAEWGLAMAGWLLSLVVVQFPDWATSADGPLGTVMGYVDGLGVWVDWASVVGVVTTCLAVWAACLLLKLLLRIFSHVPEIGGNW